MKNIYLIIPCLLAFMNFALAQAAPMVDATEEVQGPIMLEEIKQHFPSAKGAGEVAKLGSNATITVQEGQFFLNGSDTKKLMEMWGNLPQSYKGGILANDESYVITFTFNPIGYVKDDEKQNLDADELLEQLIEMQEAANKERKKVGKETLTVTGWATEPKYNEETNNLEWALKLKAEDGTETVNHNIKILGRKGVTDATLICDPATLDSLLPTLDNTLATFAYTQGNKYSEYKEGDKVAEYGLKALMLGGGVYAASKMGLFALLGKFWKAIVAGIIVVGAALKSFIFGKKKEAS